MLEVFDNYILVPKIFENYNLVHKVFDFDNLVPKVSGFDNLVICVFFLHSGSIFAINFWIF